MSHIQTSHVSHTNESCLTYKRVMSHIQTSHVSQINESCLKYKRVMSHIQTRHVSQINESRLTNTNESVMPHKWISHVTQISHGTHTNESWHTYEWVMANKWMSHVTRHTSSSKQNTREGIGLVTRINESFHPRRYKTSLVGQAHARIMPHKWIKRVLWHALFMSCDMCEAVSLMNVWGCFSHEYSWEKQPHTWINHVTGHRWIKHVTRHASSSKHNRNARLTYKRVMSHK